MIVRSHPTDPALRWTLLAALAVGALTVVALRVTPPPPLPADVGPMFPRVRAPVGPGAGELLRSMGVGSLTWYVCLAAAPGFVLLSRTLPLERGRWPASLGVHALVIFVLVIITALVQHRLSYGASPLAPPLDVYVRAALLTGTMPFLTVAALAQALDARSRARQRELDALRVRGQLAEARLQALTAQLQPHFLFNTLQGISTLIRSDPDAADRMLGHLSDLLREVLARGDRREVALAEELRVLAPYVELARARYGARLDVAVAAEEGTLRARVPFFVLQPLVENALDHGVGRRSGPGRVRVRAERVGDRLWLTVTDDGPGTNADTIRPGIGLTNTRTRLEELYGADHAFEYGTDPEGGFGVRVEIPLREAPGEPAA